VELVIYPKRRSIYEVLTERIDQPVGANAAESILSLLGPRDRRILAALVAPSRLFQPGEVLAHMPYVFLR
jgi:hypothetical protein